MADLNKLFEQAKTVLPVLITVGGLITGYFVFKAETQHQHAVQELHIQALRDQIDQINREVNQDRQEWQRDIEARIQGLREANIRLDVRIKVLENRQIDEE